MQCKDRIIVLKKSKYGESDLIIHGLSAKVGHLGLIAKGGLKSRKRFGGGVLEPTHFIEITYKGCDKDTSDKLHLLYEASIIKDFQELRGDYERLELALYFLQLASRVKHAHGEDAKELFDLLGNGLSAVTNSEDLTLLRAHFEAKLLFQQGVWPPELPSDPWLKTSLGRHGEIKSSGEGLKAFKRQVHSMLGQYLN